MPGEHVCRSTCNGSCKSLGGGYACDGDHFCRARCDGGGGACGGCAGSEVCDTGAGVCRPACAGGCPTGWRCVGLDLVAASVPAICVGCSPTASPTFTPPTLAPIVYYDAGSGERTAGIAVGDLGGRGPSVIAVDAAAGQLWVYPSDGSGALGPPIAYAAPGATRAAVVDVTRDGFGDVVVAATTNVLVFPGNGDGTLGSALVGATLAATSLVVGDFDGDGYDEVAVAGRGSGALGIIAGDGAGGVTLLASFGKSDGSYVRLGGADFDGDGRLDLYADDELGAIDTWLAGSGAGVSFARGPSTSLANRGDSAVFDIDGDGGPDLALLAGGALVAMLHGDGGAFGAMTDVALPGASTLAAGDIDGDGHVDLTVADQAGAALHVLSGDGTTLIYSAEIALVGGPDSVALADLDGDQMADLVVGFAAGGVGVLVNRTPPP
ncbi:MAG TPA: VCBS repeat-containing protein [Polyangia bacterium]